MKYTGSYIMCIPLTHITFFIRASTTVIEVGYGSEIVAFQFDSEAEADTAETALLSWF